MRIIRLYIFMKSIIFWISQIFQVLCRFSLMKIVSQLFNLYYILKYYRHYQKYISNINVCLQYYIHVLRHMSALQYESVILYLKCLFNQTINYSRNLHCFSKMSAKIVSSLIRLENDKFHFVAKNIVCFFKPIKTTVSF